MNWGEFKKIVEMKGLKDDSELWFIDWSDALLEDPEPFYQHDMKAWAIT